MATIVDVTILGNRYKLKSSDNEAGQLEELAARLDELFRAIGNEIRWHKGIWARRLDM